MDGDTDTPTLNHTSLSHPIAITMPTGLEEIALAFELSLATQQAGSFTKDIIKAALDETASSLLTKFELYASKRTVLFDTDPERLENGQAIFSPITQALERLYVPNDQPDSLPLPTGRTYVIYAPSNQGKTHSARDFLEEALPLFQGQNQKEIPTTQGIMITGTPGSNYFSFMSHCLGTKGCKDWIFSLIAALCPDPTIPNRQPSMLILDALDAQNEMNELFVRKLFMASKNKGFYTVILTQNAEWASYMSGMNNGAKILAHPSAMSGGSAREPIWNELTWSRDLLSRMIKKRFPEKVSEWAGEDGLITWIEPNWTPQDCIYHADSLLQSPPSPARLRRRYED